MKISRRDFLRFISVSTLAMASGQLPLDKITSKAQGRRIAIIGAGASGLMAGRILHDAGAEVVLIEARDRIGGRVLTDYTLASYPVELGAEFIHGDNVFTWDVLEALGLEDTTPALDDDRRMAFYADGRWWRYPDWLRLSGIDLIDIIEEDLAWVVPDMSIAEWLDAPIPAAINNAMASDNAADLDELGVQGYIEATYEGSGEGDFRLKAGYSALMNALSRGLHVHLGRPVQRIERTGEDVRITTEQEMFNADVVIVTLPLGVLKTGDVVFQPPLPARKQDAIEKLGAGKVNKIVVKFDAPFWDADFEALTTELDTQLWWRPDGGHHTSSAVLTALIGGRAGERFSAMSDEEAIAEGVRQLSVMFDIPNLHERLVEGRFINWGADAYSKMGYSYVPVNGAGMREILAESVDDWLYFAGEATEIEHPATVHGALMSGYRVAQQLLR